MPPGKKKGTVSVLFEKKTGNFGLEQMWQLLIFGPEGGVDPAKRKIATKKKGLPWGSRALVEHEGGKPPIRKK